MLDVKAINEDLGLTATNTRQRGEAQSPARVFTESMWGYEVHPGKEWESLEEALESILEVLMPLKDKIMKYSTKFDVNLWCGHFTSSFDGGPTFSPAILIKLGELGVELYLDTYCHSEKGEIKGDRLN